MKDNGILLCNLYTFTTIIIAFGPTINVYYYYFNIVTAFCTETLHSNFASYNPSHSLAVLVYNVIIECNCNPGCTK